MHYLRYWIYTHMYISIVYMYACKFKLLAVMILFGIKYYKWIFHNFYLSLFSFLTGMFMPLYCNKLLFPLHFGHICLDVAQKSHQRTCASSFYRNLLRPINIMSCLFRVNTFFLYHFIYLLLYRWFFLNAYPHYFQHKKSRLPLS